jgi:DNA-binding transcriptional LysR family regulator
MIDIQKIETFLCAAEKLNISEAAKQLHLSQPTVSHQIKLLEQELGATLFTRSSTGLQLTGKYILPQLAARFRLRYPGIQVRIPSCAPEKVTLDLLDGDAHLGVLSREVGDANLEIQEFFHDTIKLIVPADHRWAQRASIEPSELLEEPIIMRESTSGTRRVVLEELAKHDISLEDLNIFMELGNAEATVRTVADGYGVAFVSELAASYPLERGNIVAVPVQGLALQRTIYMVRKRVGDAYRPRDAFWSFIHAPENADLLQLPQQGT